MNYNQPQHKRFDSMLGKESPRSEDYSSDFKDSWIEVGISEETINFADNFGNKLAAGGKGLTSSQLRNFFGELRRIQMTGFKKEIPAFLLLEPKLAYAVKRKTNSQGKSELEQFYKFFKKCKKCIDFKFPDEVETRFNNLVQIMEATIAYHKFHDGKE